MVIFYRRRDMLRHIYIGLPDPVIEGLLWRWGANVGKIAREEKRRALSFENGMVWMTRVWRARSRLVKKLQCVGEYM